jgi:hypothetical protein
VEGTWDQPCGVFSAEEGGRGVIESEEEREEIWRLERLRVDEMLAFHDEVCGRITKKALAEKFNLRPGRVCLLIRRQNEARVRERLLEERELRNAEIERLKAAATFTGLAERLWMTLGWLATALEERRGARIGDD